MSTDINIDEVNRILADLERDDREGKHVAEVAEVGRGEWPSGDAYTSVDMLLTTAGGSKFNVRFNDKVPTLAEYEATKANLSRGGKAGMRNALAARANLARLYQITDPAKLTRGFKLGVDIVKDKEGFPRLKNIIALDEAMAAHAPGKAGAAKSDAQF